MTDALHTIPVADEIARICDVELKSSLDLKSVEIGDLLMVPSPGITSLVNGIWIMPTPATTNAPSELPRQLMQVYNFRLVYVRRMAVGENPTKKTMQDAATLFNKFLDKIHLPDITNIPATAGILWMMPRSIEWQPQEDDYVARVGADLVAIAINVEVAVRTRR